MLFKPLQQVLLYTPPVSVEFTVQLLFNGLVLGSIYVLIALGLTLMFGVFNVPNFAHGQTYMFGAFFTWVGVNQGIPFWFALGLAMIGTAIIGIGMDRLTYRPVMNRTEEGIPLLLVAFGLFELMGGIAEIIWGPSGRGMQFPISGAYIQEGIIFTYDRITIIVIGLVLMIGLHLVIQRTKYGKALRAISQDRVKATTLGIKSGRMSLLTFAIGSSLAGLAGGLIGALFGLSPYMGLEPVLKAFVIVVIGGMGSILGAILGGYLIGVTEAFAIGYLEAEYSTILAFSVLYVLLIVKPEGIFGEKEER